MLLFSLFLCCYLGSFQFVIVVLILDILEGNTLSCSKCELQLHEIKNTVIFIMLGFVLF